MESKLANESACGQMMECQSFNSKRLNLLCIDSNDQELTMPCWSPDDVGWIIYEMCANGHGHTKIPLTQQLR